ncbi:nuclear transport factor 2 family protein [Maribacter sp. 2308TA10-17]|uniref:nuclear transport factor 2 family protein n=1 Tax=Maribacter sp. 2308TA10-17 TaxID=3386276 RepID=UPI0039BCCAB4
MRKFTLLVLFFSIAFVSAQDAQSIQKEINETLWKPFKAAFENIDGPALNALYGKQVLRVTPNGIDTENKFKEANLKRFENNKSSQANIQLDFWFDSRHTNSDTSYEVGFYRMQLTNPGGENTIYGQFHIVLKRIDGVWKIIQDWDTTRINGNAISASDFEKQAPIQFE